MASDVDREVESEEDREEDSEVDRDVNSDNNFLITDNEDEEMNEEEEMI